MLKIIPSILTNDISEAKQLLTRCEGVVDRVSFDVIDGKFADNKTIFPDQLITVESSLAFDFQLMVDEPINWVEKCVRAGADRIIGHVEKMASQKAFVEKVYAVGRKVGLALDLTTPVSAINPDLFTDLDVVLLMSVPAGFGGQKFNLETLDKVELLNKIRAKDNTPFVIQDDGGVTLEYIDDVRREGVDEVSIGRKIFDGDVRANIEKFLKASYS